jgi:DNA-binding MarR family transcriptional regulator
MNDLKLDEVYLFLLERTVRQFRVKSKKFLSSYGVDISGEQWVILKRIYEQEGINQREIAGLTYKDPASVTRMIDLLEKQELVNRRDIDGDRRSYNLFLTKKGIVLVEKVIPLAKELRKQGIKSISKQDMETFKNVLNKIYENLS